MTEEQFKNKWGQSHETICANLGYDHDTADELLLDDYFWLEDTQEWYPKDSSFYTKEEEKIADKLYYSR
jgi:hypothetical protein